jgi:hypothetical protein
MILGGAVRLAALTLLLALLAQTCSAQSDLYLIALMGQSNMAGRGEVSELPPDFPKNPTKIWTFTNAYKWEPAREPVDSPEGQVDTISQDRSGGVGPSLALADAFVSRYPSTSVGLIPCARGATRIGMWLKTDTDRPRDTLFGSCVNRIKTVSPANGTLRAVLFWQGGSDAIREETAVTWKERFTTFVADLRRDLGNPDLPVIMIMLGKKMIPHKFAYWEIVREQQRAVNIPGVIKIEADGFERREDGIHFTTKSQLEFGAVLAGLLPAP